MGLTYGYGFEQLSVTVAFPRGSEFLFDLLRKLLLKVVMVLMMDVSIEEFKLRGIYEDVIKIFNIILFYFILKNK